MNKIAIGLAAVLTLAACASSDESSTGSTQAPDAAADTTDAAADTTDAVETTDAAPETTEAASGAEDGVLEVPGEFGTIQAAVDASSPGDLVLIGPGTYNEAVNVVTDEITIRGLDRNEVVLDGDFELDNGIRVLGASDVIVQNLTAQNYTSNGVFWTSTDGYRGSYITAYRNGDYGIYAFDAINGQLDNSYAAGSPDAGFYIGQCFPCDSLIIDVRAEHNGLGYSGTNSGGNLLIANSVFNNNRAGIVPNSGSYELCYPERDTSIIGNLVYSNNQPDTPAIDVAILAMGNGILVPGGVQNLISRNRVFDHDKTGVGLVPFLEEGANDDLPGEEEWTIECSEQRLEPLSDEIPESLLWEPYDNIVRDNAISDSRVADLAAEGVSAPTGTLRNCWAGNQITSSAPANVEALANCDGEPVAADDPAWAENALNVLGWLIEVENAPPSVDYEIAELPPIPDLDDMPDAATAPAEPATDMPRAVDVDAITTPTR